MVSVSPPYNGLAIASVAVLLAYIPILTPIAQIVLGLKAREQIRTTNEQGDGLAIAGIVVGITGLVLTVVAIVLILAIVAFAATHTNTGTNTNTGTFTP